MNAYLYYLHLCTSVRKRIENLKYHFVYVRVNSSDNQATSDVNLVDF